MSATPPILELREVHKIFENGTHALRGVNVTVKPGEFVAIIGLSGSGKSTLLRSINQLYPHTSGQIFFEGSEITKGMSHRELRALRKNIAMIFQQFNLIKRATVLTNVLTGGLASASTLTAMCGIFPSSQIERARECLRLVGLTEKMHVRADNLSGGQQQRVAIARALMQSPKLLLADEPVASLDPSLAHSVMDYLKKINEDMGTTVLCNLHFLSLVRQYSSRVIGLVGGRVVYDGSPDSVNEKWFREIYGEEAREVQVK